MITLGVYEKFVMADNLSKVVDSIVSSDARGISLAVAFLMFSFVIYYDFAGYSRIAIGLGRLMGVRLADNFHAPYFSTSIKEFWRRWHISLSSWFRDYLYIPMGGNKKGRIRRDLNTLLVFTVSGAWHGSALGYWLWGLIHGLFLVIENGFRSIFGKRKRTFGAMRIPLDMLKRTAVFILVSFAWVPFYAGGIDKTFSMFGRMFTGDDTFFERLYDGFGLNKKIWLVLVISFVLYLVIALLDEHFKYKLHEKVAGHGVIIFILAVVLYTVLILVGDYGSEYDAATFIYGGF
jgi:D-alanyl-lipoteichoic acid acyltransferase DltB (MBOAT superfamily)